jgi:hypothetical protein
VRKFESGMMDASIAAAAVVLTTEKWEGFADP